MLIIRESYLLYLSNWECPVGNDMFIHILFIHLNMCYNVLIPNNT